MNSHVHLIVEKGPDAGKKISVPACGGRLGRSSKNDIVLSDPTLSRHHCRLYFKTDDGLWITDLGSSNETLVNNMAVQDVRIKPGDVISIGDSTIKVVDDKILELPTASAHLQHPDDKSIDLGLSGTEGDKNPSGKRLGTGKLLILSFVVAVLCACIWLPKLLTKPAIPVQAPIADTETTGPIEIEYEKIQATAANIFRYAVTIDASSTINVEIDDLKNDTHVKKQSTADPELIKGIAAVIKDEGFYALNDKYEGLRPDEVEQYDLSVTHGKKTHRCVVLNQTEPEQFKKSRETLEAFVMNEMGLWAIQYSSDKLKQMAEEAYLLGKKFYEEREIAFSNLSQAVKKLTEAQWYLETVQPKPEYYESLIKGLEDSKKELQTKYDDRMFKSKKAAKLGEWDEAAKEVRIIIDMLPDRADQRNKDARKELNDIERRINTKSKR